MPVSHCDTMYIMSHVHSCWLSAEEGTIFAFVVPMLVIILVNLRLCVMLEFMVDLAWDVGGNHCLHMNRCHPYLKR